MNRSFLAGGLLVATTCACGSEPGAVRPPPCDGEGGATHRYVLTAFHVERPTPEGTLQGFDLDARVSDDTDEQSCFHADFTSPPPEAQPGIDGQFGPILDAIVGSFDLAGATEVAILRGAFVYVVTIGHVDGLANDDCVSVELRVGRFPSVPPEVDMDFRTVAGQTVLDVRSAGAFGAALIRDGRLEARDGRIEIEVPAVTGPAFLRMDDARLRATIAAGALLDGVMGGSLDADAHVASIVATGPMLPPASILAVLEAQADLDQDARGACHGVSASSTFEAVPAR